MSRRATSLVALTGFFTCFTLSAGVLVGQAPRKAIKSAGDLPAFSYTVTGTNAEVFKSEEAFRPVAEKLRADIASLLRDYTIDDRTTLRGLHGTLLTLDLLDNRTEEAHKEIVIVRDLEDKPAAKQMSGLLEEALLDSGGTKTDRQEFLRRYSAALNRLPWDVVGDAVKEWKRRFETINESPAAPAVETQSPAVRQTRVLDLPRAQGLAERRFVLVIAKPVKKEAIEALATYIAAHNGPNPDIWAARSVTLDAGMKAQPVVIGIWDTGVDRSLFREQLATDGPVPGFDFYGNRTEGELLAFDAKQKERWPQTMTFLKGSDDIEARVDTPAASAFRKYLSTLKPEDWRAYNEWMRFVTHYIHGTHVAGIALEGNPFGRIVVVRDGFPYQMPPPPPTLDGARKFAAGATELTAYLRKQGARVVNMSWTVTLAGDFETALQANNVGAGPAERRKMAQEMLGVARDGLRKALASTPEILYVAAAGNTNSNSTFDEDVWASMTDLPNLLVAGAVDQAGIEASFTSFGPAVAVYANGYQVESYIPGGERLKRSGTSMAAPNVTNLAAKLIALDPSLTPIDVVKLIRDGSDLSTNGRFRLINPKRSVELLRARAR
jgi:subtilisin family serine protease